MLIYGVASLSCTVIVCVVGLTAIAPVGAPSVVMIVSPTSSRASSVIVKLALPVRLPAVTVIVPSAIVAKLAFAMVRLSVSLFSSKPSCVMATVSVADVAPAAIVIPVAEPAL